MSHIFGEPRQNGYVVRDIEAAMAHWAGVLGVGPWFSFGRVLIEDFRYRGAPSSLEVSIALASSGALQIERIQPRNDAPSMDRDFLAAGREGLQHLACWTERFDDDLARLGALGHEIGQSGRIGESGRFVYLRTESHPGTVIELSDVSGPKGRLFARIARAAREWDGREPIRRLGV